MKELSQTTKYRPTLPPPSQKKDFTKISIYDGKIALGVIK